MDSRQRISVFLVLGISGAVIAGVFAFVRPIPQWPAYHLFADQRTLLGIPNALNVLSNLPLLYVGALGIAWTRAGGVFKNEAARVAWYVVFAGATLTGFGSAYYHLKPNNESLVWDRLPMAITFMGLLCAVVSETVSPRAGVRMIAPMVAAGVGSVIYWIVTEHRGHGDLRPYGLVQFLPGAIIVGLLLLFPPQRRTRRYYFYALGWYGASKVLEALDAPIYGLGHLLSGHTLKHLAAAGSVYQLAAMVRHDTTATVSNMNGIQQEATETTEQAKGRAD